ncbi:N-acetylmuramoyl-L-alanine amidase [Dysgonomonas sp. 511]|uniref:N-acetylmuramoyl-L-alanine amidase family protein n=1 Tax=Dysgonomonas sp. 511 TaxID=2302930 RepID=UPI0013CF5613|nr:N-acetylmuramoyl-L-alanine amidase [Dysgonomonas sp. 511]NDV79889.1 N-acetylmuramoyl-L-alanine amidase [Dysgonomonas sp. 511]
MKYIRIIFFLFFTTICLTNALAQANSGKPRNGEGTHDFLIRHKRSPAKHYDQFIKLNKGKFGRNKSLLKDVTYILPPLSKENTSPQKNVEAKSKGKQYKQPLFGKKYENYSIKSDELKGTCFYLVSGHGGPDPGAVGKINGKTVCEDEYAYDIILRLARTLMEKGAKVHIIIQDSKDGIRDAMYLACSKKNETCMGSTIPLNPTARLEQRSNKINTLAKKDKEKYKRSVFVHLDSRSKKHQLDVFFYHAPGSKAGEKLAITMSRTFKEQYGKHQPKRGFTGTVTPRDLYVLRNTTPIAIFAELGNIQNSFDQKRFLDYNQRQALANWMVKGLLKDYENSKMK